MSASIASEDTLRLTLPAHDDVTHSRPIVRCSSARAVRPSLELRLSLARAFIRAHRDGRDTATLAQLDQAYLATRQPLADDESYED